MEAGAPSAAGWKALCGLLYQSLQYTAALRATEAALAWLEGQAAAGHEYLSQCALFLKVIHARSLLKMGRVDAAEEEFGVLAGEEQLPPGGGGGGMHSMCMLDRRSCFGVSSCWNALVWCW